MLAALTWGSSVESGMRTWFMKSLASDVRLLLLASWLKIGKVGASTCTHHRLKSGCGCQLSAAQPKQ